MPHSPPEEARAPVQGNARRPPRPPGTITARRATFLAALLAGVLGCGDGGTGPEPSAEVDFAALLEDFTEQHGIGAAALGVMWDGVIVHEGVTGFMDAGRGIPVTPDVMMRIASVTKPVTAAAVRRLVADGLLATNGCH